MSTKQKLKKRQETSLGNPPLLLLLIKCKLGIVLHLLKMWFCTTLYPLCCTLKISSIIWTFEYAFVFQFKSLL